MIAQITKKLAVRYSVGSENGKKLGMHHRVCTFDPLA